MRGLAALLALALAACSARPAEITPSPSPTHEAGTTLVTVLLDLSGPRAPSGIAQRNAMQLWLDQAQARGGRPRLRARFVDLAGSDARLLVEVRRAAELDAADVLVIGVPFAYDETFARALAVARLPVVLTLPAPEPMSRSGGGWAFGLAPTFGDLARAAVSDATQRGVLQPILLASDESPPAVAERLALATELGRRGHIPPTVVTVTAQDAAARVRAGASFARSAHFTGPGATYLDATRSLAAAGITPRVYLSYLMESSDASALREGAELATWPGSRNLAAASTAPTTPERAVFVQTYAARHGPPSTLAASAYDALALVDAAAESAGGTPDRARLRDRLEATTFAGITTRYSFTPARHAGFDPVDLAYLRWSTGARVGFALAPEPADPKAER
jgi:ABC-type branched-subunit amino acid transport system substrate-binding protein